LSSYLNTLIDTLAKDHRRGAAEIVKDATVLFRDIARSAENNEPGAAKLFSRAVRRLAKGQPSMAPVLNLLNHVCIAKEQSEDDWKKFGEYFSVHVQNWNALREQMLARVGVLPRTGDTLMTYSNSSTVARHIITCHERFGWPKQVLCSEGRPIQEGLVMARKLKSAGVKVILYTDAALMSRIVEVGSVWVGGDSLSRVGLVNKVGSRAQAMLASEQNISYISLMTTDKLLTPGLLPFFRFLPQNPREIAADEAEGLEIVNEYYETIPLEYVSQVFTEKGLAKPNRLVASIENEPVSSLFKDLVQV